MTAKRLPSGDIVKFHAGGTSRSWIVDHARGLSAVKEFPVAV